MLGKIKSLVYVLRNYGIRSCFFNFFSILISDTCVVSFQKSGRTWLRVMLAKLLSLKYNKKVSLETQTMTLFKPDPNVFFSHAGCTHNNNPLNFGKMLKKKRIVLLVRDPRDEIVSLYHDHTKRNFWYQGDISSFIRNPDWGLKKVLNFMNLWAEEMSKRKEDFLLIKYEDMKNDTKRELKKILNFLNIQASEEIIDKAVKYGSFENMRKIELKGEIKDWRIKPVNPNDPNSFKTRKGKIGSHKEELNLKDIDYINKEVKEKLDPIFKY